MEEHVFDCLERLEPLHIEWRAFSKHDISESSSQYSVDRIALQRVDITTSSALFAIVNSTSYLEYGIFLSLIQRNDPCSHCLALRVTIMVIVFQFTFILLYVIMLGLDRSRLRNAFNLNDSAISRRHRLQTRA